VKYFDMFTMWSDVWPEISRRITELRDK